MKSVTRYWASAIAAVFIMLLIALAVYQLKWIADMGERQRARLTQDLAETAEELSQAIRDEFLVLPAVFGMDEANAEEIVTHGAWDDFSRRWRTWKVYAMDTSIVAGFHIVDLGRRDSSLAVSTWDGERFVPDRTPALAAELEQKVHERGRHYGRLALPPPEIDDIILPLDPRRPIVFFIRIDRAAVAQHLIPRLADRFFRAKTEYFFRIIDLDTGKTLYATPGIQTAALFAQPDLRFPLSGKERLDLFAEAPPPEDHPVWMLEAVHRSGSLAAVVRAESLKNEALVLGLSLLLAGAFVILAVGVRRQQDFAERQNEFIASITHELKTPIAVIRAAADNLADGVVRDPERTVKYGGAIKRESGRLAEMIDRLLAYARVGEGSHLNFESVDLRPLATRIVNGFRAELEDARFEVDLSLPEDPVMVRGDTVALEFALGNLVSNALKHAREGLYLGIDVRVERNEKDAPIKGEWAVISVADRGPGIARRERKLVFEAFYRGSNAKRTQVPGSGIGLVLVRRVAEAHGGSIRLEDSGEIGSTFVVRIPLEVRNA